MSIGEKVLASLEPVLARAQHVVFVEDVIEQFAQSVDVSELYNTDIKGDKSLTIEMTPEDHIAYCVILGTLQFCFWGDPKWTIDVEGIPYDGSEALIRSVKRGIQEGYPLLQPRYLASLDKKDLGKIFRGTPEIPFLEERVKMLNRLGNMVVSKYSGKFSTIITHAQGDVNAIVTNLVEDAPDVFDDTVNFHGKIVHFYKRAQIIAYYLFELSRQGTIPDKVFGKEELTGLADYRAPQILRSLGILKYDNHLANLVDNKIEIAAGSDEEIEIRAFTLKAEHAIAQILKERVPAINDSLVHRILWFRCQKITIDTPYHRTRTIWY